MTTDDSIDQRTVLDDERAMNDKATGARRSRLQAERQTRGGGQGHTETDASHSPFDPKGIVTGTRGTLI